LWALFYLLQQQWYHAKKITLVNVQKHTQAEAVHQLMTIQFTLILILEREQKIDVMQMLRPGLIWAEITVSIALFNSKKVYDYV
jgi:hypothetical protein